MTSDSLKPNSDAATEVTLRESTPLVRARLPDTRNSITHKFNISGHEGYITVGLDDSGRPGEVFIKMAKQGSTMSGLMDTIGILTSVALQYGVPVEALVRKLENTRFEPSGWTPNAAIGEATSVVDYLFRWLDLTFSPINPDGRPGVEGDARMNLLTALAHVRSR
jgi:ribonucleoside-diphosphate reductase alpha chain